MFQSNILPLQPNGSLNTAVDFALQIYSLIWQQPLPA